MVVLLPQHALLKEACPISMPGAAGHSSSSRSEATLTWFVRQVANPPLVDRQTLRGPSPRVETQYTRPLARSSVNRSARLDGGRKPSRSRHLPTWATVWSAATAQPAIAQIALHVLRQVEEAILKHVGGVDPTLEPHVHAELDHPAKAVAVALEQVSERGDLRLGAARAGERFHRVGRS